MTFNPVLEGLATRLSDEATEFLTAYGRRHQFKAGDLVVREGEPCRDVYIVLAGRARIIKNDACGNSNLIAVADQGAIIGEMGVFTDLKRSASIVAEHSLTLLELANADFLTALQHFPALTLRLLRSLSIKLNDVNQRLVGALQTQHLQYLGMRLLALQSTAAGASGHTLELDLDTLCEQSGMQLLDITTALLSLQRMQLISDLRFSDGNLADCRPQTLQLRAFLERGARER